jgi:hypothetical protein
MLQVIESPYPVGATVTFTGTVLARIPAQQRDTLRDWLHRGLALVPALGGLKGNGFGRIEQVEGIDVRFDTFEPHAIKLPDAVKGSRRVGLRVHPETPFCFARPAPGKRNVVVSEDFIPGGALIAAIAQRLEEDHERWPALRFNLDRLHLTHAHPVAKGAHRRPIQAPLGISKVDKGFIDLEGVTDLTPLHGQAPAFAIDWKRQDHSALARALAGTAYPAGLRRRLRLRNEIDRESGTARDGVLFSQETVLPDACDWLANLDLTATTDPAACLAELADLLQEPLTHLGKTKAVATLDIDKSFAPTQISRRRDPGRVVLVLQSPARLLPADLRIPSTNGGDALHRAYAAAWSELSAGALAMRHSFAAQHLRGGGYWWHRFRLPDKATDYRPQIFTNTGSVFVLDLLDADRAEPLLRDWAARGLPQLADAPGGEDWRYNPWIAANGYGEILLDPDLDACLQEVV